MLARMPRRLIGSLRSGWSHSRGPSCRLLAAATRIAVLVFVFHISGAAH
jgi:hypothetical protein